MGNNPSSSSSSTPQQVQTTKPNFSATYQLVKKIDDPLYGEIRIVRDTKTGEIIYLKEIIVNNFEDFQAESKVYNQRIAVSHPNVVRILGYNAPNEPNPVSGYYKISVYIEVLQKTLADELNVRLETGIPFGENDILLVAESLIAALSYFETQNIFHGDVRPANIFVSRHAYKLSDPYLKTKKNANALSNAIINEPDTIPLLSPQLLVQVPHQDFEIRCKKNKADVFSLGATLLSLASLSKSEELYDYDYGTFDLDQMKQRLEKVRKNFSKFTYELIRDMLRLPEDSRPDFNTLATRLRPFQDDIVKKGELPFFAQRAPYADNDEDDDYYIQLFRHNEQLKAQSRVSPQKVPVQASPYRQGGYDQGYDYEHHVQRESPQQQRYSHQQQQQRYSPAHGGYDQGSGAENVYTVNLEDEDYQYGHHDDGLDFNYTEGAHAHERASHSQSPNRYQERSSYRDDMMPVQQSISPEKNLKRTNPQIYVEPQRNSHHPQYVQEDLKRSSPQQFRQSQVQQPTNKIYIDINQQQHLLQQQQLILQQQEQQRIQREQEQARLRQQQEQQYYQQQQQAQNYRPPVQTVQNAQTVNIMTLDKPDELEARIKAALSRSQTTYQAAVTSATQSQVVHTPQYDPLRGSQTYGGQQSLGSYLTQQQTASYQPANVNTAANYAAVPKEQHLAHSYTATTTTNVPGGYQNIVGGDNYNYGQYTMGGGQQTLPGSYLAGAGGSTYGGSLPQTYGVPSTHTH